MSVYRPRPLPVSAAILFQIAVLLVPEVYVIIGAFLVFAVILVLTLPLRRLARWLRGLVVLLLLVLLTRTLTAPFDRVLGEWFFYSTRLVTSVSVAFILYETIGLVGIVSTISRASAIVPIPSVRRFVDDTLRSLLFLFPLLTTRLTAVREAYNVRRERPGNKRRRWIGRLLLVYITATSSVPKARAEALLIRSGR